MPKFIVCIQEILYADIEVDAKNATEARNIVQKQLDDGIYPDLDDSHGVEISNIVENSINTEV